MTGAKLRQARLGLALVASLVAATAGSARAQALLVVDGDTLRLGDERIRLWGIDAPEAETPEGEAATKHMRELIDGLAPGALACERLGLDPHGRTVARCRRTGGDDLACAMVRAGHARDWPRHSGGFCERCREG